MTNQSFINGDVNVKVVCRVWDGVVVGNRKNSDNWMWFFNDQLLFRQELGTESVQEDEASLTKKTSPNVVILRPFQGLVLFCLLLHLPMEASSQYPVSSFPN